MVVGDFNGDGYADIFVSSNGVGYVLFGHANPWAASVTFTANADGTHGFEVPMPG